MEDSGHFLIDCESCSVNNLKSKSPYLFFPFDLFINFIKTFFHK